MSESWDRIRIRQTGGSRKVANSIVLERNGKPIPGVTGFVLEAHVGGPVKITITQFIDLEGGEIDDVLVEVSDEKQQ